MDREVDPDLEFELEFELDFDLDVDLDLELELEFDWGPRVGAYSLGQRILDLATHSSDWGLKVWGPTVWEPLAMDLAVHPLVVQKYYGGPLQQVV